MKGYRTFALSAVVAVLGALATLDYSDVVTAQTAGIVGIVIAAAIAIARAFTTTPPGAAEHPAETILADIEAKADAAPQAPAA